MRRFPLKSLYKVPASLAFLLCLVCAKAEASDLAALSTPTTSSTSLSGAADTALTRPMKFAVVNFRKCIESSKQGKQHQTSFEGMKSQMESLLQQKEKAITELNAKLNDSDYLDGLTKEAENELKHKFRVLTQEYTQAQQQFMQTLQQANLKIIEMMHTDVAKASAEVARVKGFTGVFNEESFFFFEPALDVSELVITEMNKAHEIEQKKRDEVSKGNAKTTTPAPTLPVK